MSSEDLQVIDLRRSVGFSWEICPPEILWEIFKYLDGLSLALCLYVSKRWKIITTEFLDCFDLWEKVVRDEMENEGVTFRRKTTFGWRNMFMNSKLWYYVNSANINRIHVYRLLDIEKVCMYKDKIILKTEQDTVYYYNVQNFEQIKVTETLSKGLDYAENDSMVVALTQMGNSQRGLFLYGKPTPDSCMFDNKAHYVDQAFLFKLEDNICYVATASFAICACIWTKNKWRLRLVGRYYGSEYDRPAAMHVYENVVYMVTKYGFVLNEITKTKSFYKVFHYSIPQNKGSCKWVLFHKYNVAVAVESKHRRIKIRYDKETDHIRFECPNMSCATEHGHVIFIGFKNGKVVICITNKEITKGHKADRVFRVQDYDKTIRDPYIVAIEVFEGKQCHHLLVVLRDRVVQLLLTYHKEITDFYD